jgi:hypothetical protein
LEEEEHPGFVSPLGAGLEENSRGRRGPWPFTGSRTGLSRKCVKKYGAWAVSGLADLAVLRLRVDLRPTASVSWTYAVNRDA